MVFVDIYTLSDFWASGRNLSIKSIIIIIIIYFRVRQHRRTRVAHAQ